MESRPICATPHIRHDHDVRIAELADRVEALNPTPAPPEPPHRRPASSPAERWRRPLLYGLDRRGARQGRARRRLLDPARARSGAAVRFAPRRRETLVSSWAVQTLIAHPERHLGPRAIETLTALIHEGALVQGTAAMLVADDGSPLLDLAQSRADPRAGKRLPLGPHRPPGAAIRRVSPPLTRIPSIEPHTRWVTETAPAAIIAGEGLETPFPPA